MQILKEALNLLAVYVLIECFNNLLKYCDTSYKSRELKAIPEISDREEVVNSNVNKQSYKVNPFIRRSLSVNYNVTVTFLILIALPRQLVIYRLAIGQLIDRTSIATASELCSIKAKSFIVGRDNVLVA